jgi:RsiW-degrading membrane proteinase PrsW (M82 family)
VTVSLIYFLAFLGGFLPALLWLIFWQLEDRCDPEPKKLIFIAFGAGMLVVPLAIPLEYLAQSYLAGPVMLLVWATIEEVLKFGAAWLLVLRNRAIDEPIDAIIYMLTVALGFAALENTLFLLGPLQGGDTLTSVITGNVRFIGATLLHTLASATIGVAIALSFYRNASVRRAYLFGGVVLSVILHTIFNFLILEKGGAMTFPVFLFVWLGVIVILLFFERLKQPSRDYC